MSHTTQKPTFKKSKTTGGRVFVSDEDRTMLYNAVIGLLRKKPVIRGFVTLLTQAQNIALPKSLRRDFSYQNAWSFINTATSKRIMEEVGLYVEDGEFRYRRGPNKNPRKPKHVAEAPKDVPAVKYEAPEPNVELPDLTTLFHRLYKSTVSLEIKMEEIKGIVVHQQTQRNEDMAAMLDLMRTTTINSDKTLQHMAGMVSRMEEDTHVLQELFGVAPELPVVQAPQPAPTHKQAHKQAHKKAINTHQGLSTTPAVVNPHLEALDQLQARIDPPHASPAPCMDVKLPRLLLFGAKQVTVDLLNQEFDGEVDICTPVRGVEPYPGLAVFVMTRDLESGIRQQLRSRYFKKTGVHFMEIHPRSGSTIADAIWQWLGTKPQRTAKNC